MSQPEVSQETPRDIAAALFSPMVYGARWPKTPLAELDASSVREPGKPERSWLVHRKSFEHIQVGDFLVGDPNQQIPLCPDCLAPLRASKPRMPKYSLANDLWIGILTMPPCLGVRGA